MQPTHIAGTVVLAIALAGACRSVPPQPERATLTPSPVAPAGARLPVLRSIERCSAPTAAALPPIIDDFEDLRPGQDAWFSYGDDTPEAVLERKVETVDGARALHVVTRGFASWGAGVGVALGAAARAGLPAGGTSGDRCEVDGTAYDGIRFRVRGHGRLRVAVATTPLVSRSEGGGCDLGPGCFDWPGRDVPVAGDAWTDVTLPFCELAPLGWGRSQATVDATHLFAVHFRFGEHVASDVWIDDVAFIARAPGAAAPPACAPRCPLAAVPAAAKEVVDPPRLLSRYADAGITVHTFEQQTRACGPLTRRYLAYVPRRLPARAAVPIVMALHGYGASAESFLDMQARNRFQALAERDGYLVVFANAAPGAATSAITPNSGAWRIGHAGDVDVDDVAYLDLVLEDLRRRDVVDGQNRVFLVGHSLGGGMILAAARRQPARYAGLAALMPFAGWTPRPPASARGEPPPLLLMWSDSDPGLPPGYAPVLRRLAADWAAAAGVASPDLTAPRRRSLPDRVNEGASYAGTDSVALASRGSHGEQLDWYAPGGEAGGAPAGRLAVRAVVFDRAGHFLPSTVEHDDGWAVARWGFRNHDVDAPDLVWAFFREALDARPR